MTSSSRSTSKPTSKQDAKSPTRCGRPRRVGLFCVSQNARELMLLPAQLFIALFNLCGGVRLQASEYLQQPRRVEGFKLRVGLRATRKSRRRYDDDRDL